METGGDGIDLSPERRARGVYCKRCKQILDILHNRDRKPSPNLFDKEHTIGDDNRAQDMRRIYIELLESRNLQAGNNFFGR